jgi:hypothetical protein
MSLFHPQQASEQLPTHCGERLHLNDGKAPLERLRALVQIKRLPHEGQDTTRCVME